MTVDKNKIGALGEKAAGIFLEKHGYRILSRNFRTKCGEIDIVASDGDIIAFVEVKTRKNVDFGYPADFVNKSKREKLRRASLMYPAGNASTRFDIIEVFYRLEGNTFTVTEINHIEGAF